MTEHPDSKNAAHTVHLSPGSPSSCRPHLDTGLKPGEPQDLIPRRGWGVPKIILGQGALLLNCLERCYLAGSWETPSLITISQEKEMLIS